ncbi:hypothetical protein [Motiliproteus sp. SC1-56]|uniref:hypothetical protein n=1 Tax=Motiliproteus sp. SC1-56 TaxID=2799565 RepID=UPI001A90BD10|nr:hypothetical protein [Motiliproteus sp. SC1-56]
MQIGSISTNVQGLLGNSNTGVDGSQRTATEISASGKPDDSAEASGKVSSSEAVLPAAQSLGETAVDSNQAAPQTQVITSADEVLGTNLDTTA